MKKTIRLTESDLHRIIRECVNQTLNEFEENDDYVVDEGVLGDIWTGIKDNAYRMTHRSEAMPNYYKRTTSNQRMKDADDKQRRERMIQRKESGTDRASRERRKMIRQREGLQ